MVNIAEIPKNNLTVYPDKTIMLYKNYQKITDGDGNTSYDCDCVEVSLPHTQDVEAEVAKNFDFYWNKGAAMLADSARKKRNELLSACDTMLVSDRPNVDLVAWKAYRQKLRDVPEQEYFPFNITWPTKPND